MAETNLSAFIWSVADLLRGDYKQSDYGKVILPFTVLRRLDCVLEPTKAAVLEEKALREGQGLDPEPFMLRKAGQLFCNSSALDMQRLMGDADNIGENLRSYVQAFSPAVRDIFESFEFHLQVDRLEKANLLYLITEKFSQIDLHPETVSNAEMGLVFEELIRKFAELSNETAGEHFTPREVIRLDGEPDLHRRRRGTHPTRHRPQPLRPSLWNRRNAERGGGTPGQPQQLSTIGAEWSGAQPRVLCHLQGRHADQGARHQQHLLRQHPLRRPAGRREIRLHALQPTLRSGVEKDQEGNRSRTQGHGLLPVGLDLGLPRVSDGSLLFLMHLISKMRPAQDGGCRFGIVLNGSPLFTGGAGSGESEIRRYVLENDLLEGIIALPTDMFYNTGISTYIWILSNKKPAERKGKVQLIDASEFWQKMRKSLGKQAQGALSGAH